MAGPATNIATLLIFLKVLGRRFVAVYLITIVVFSYGFGLLFDLAFPNTQLAISGAASHAHGGNLLATISWWEWAASATLALALVRVFWVKSRGLLSNWMASRSHPLPDDENTMVINVSGMSCEHCRNTVERALKSIPGVESVRVSLKTGEAVIRGNGLDEVTLVNAVRQVNYDARVQASPNASIEMSTGD